MLTNCSYGKCQSGTIKRNSLIGWILIFIVTMATGSFTNAKSSDTFKSTQQTATNNIQTDPAIQAAEDLVQRLLPDHGDRFIFALIPSETEKDVFEIETRRGKVIIGGNSGISMAMGLNWYLKY